MIKNISENILSLLNTKIFCLGDLMLDKYIIGSTNRISPEGPIPVLDIEKDNGYGADNDNSLLVNLTEDETRYGINYTNIIPILINSIKELSAKVEELEKG